MNILIFSYLTIESQMQVALLSRIHHGKMRDGKEIAVKSMNESSCHGNQQFVNEVEFNFVPSAFSNLNSDRQQVLL